MFENASEVDGVREVTPETASTQLSKVRLIDVREPSEFTGELGHIAGAELVPLKTVHIVSDDWDKSATWLVVCRSGGRSTIATKELMQLGFKSVFNLKGGMLAWNAAKLPVER